MWRALTGPGGLVVENHLHDPGRVAELWADLAWVSPSADVVTEGRIVYAGALADQGRLPEALELLRKLGGIDLARPGALFDAIETVDRVKIAETLAAREPGLRAIYDFTDLTDLRIPAAQIAERARKPTAVGGLRIIVASRAFAGQKGRSGAGPHHMFQSNPL